MLVVVRWSVPAVYALVSACLGYDMWEQQARLRLADEVALRVEHAVLVLDSLGRAGAAGGEEDALMGRSQQVGGGFFGAAVGQESRFCFEFSNEAYPVFVANRKFFCNLTSDGADFPGMGVGGIDDTDDALFGNKVRQAFQAEAGVDDPSRITNAELPQTVVGGDADDQGLGTRFV